MFLRSKRWAASVLALEMSAATVVAQPPAAPMNAAPASNSLIAPSSAYPQEGVNYSFDEGGNFYDELDLSPQFRFQADWVYYTRENRAKALPVISGDESFTTKGADFNYNSGYRLTLGWMNDDFEFEGSYFELNGLDATSRGTLTNAVVFDDQSGFNAASAATQATFGAVPNFLESNTFFAPINAAANFAVAPNREDTELEFLDPGAQYVVKYDSSLQDFDFNLKGRRQTGRLFRFGVGYRNIQFHESGSVALRGAFNTIDNDPIVPDASNGLSDTALTDTLTGGGLTAGVGANGFQQANQLLLSSSSQTSNQLNGVQATMDGTFLETDYFQIGGFAKAGVYNNHARGSVAELYRNFESSPSSYTRSFSDSQNRVAFVGNLGLTGTIFLRDYLRLFGSYELMYLSGVALAPDQSAGISTSIANVTSLNLQSHGQAFFHGARVGFEILFP
jgi:hypothetical protein